MVACLLIFVSYARRLQSINEDTNVRNYWSRLTDFFIAIDVFHLRIAS